MQRQVADEAAHPAGHQVERFARQLVLARERRLGDLRRLEGLQIGPCPLDQCAIEGDQPLAAEHVAGQQLAVMGDGGGNIQFAVERCRKRRESAGAGHRQPSVAGPDECRGAQTGARPDDQLGRMQLGVAVADVEQVVVGHVRQGQRQRLELVDEGNVLRTGDGANVVPVERPWQVLHARPVALDHAGDRQPDLVGDRRNGLEVALDGFHRALEIGAVEKREIGNAQLVDIGRGEADVGAADGAHQRMS